MLQVLVTISQNFCCRKETWGYAKVIQKKRRKEKRLRKNGHESVRDIENNGYLDARLEKKRRKMNKYSPCSLVEIFLRFK